MPKQADILQRYRRYIKHREKLNAVARRATTGDSSAAIEYMRMLGARQQTAAELLDEAVAEIEALRARLAAK